MNENITQISTYLEMVPSWAIALFTFAIVVGIFIEIINRKRRFYAIDNFRNTIETEFAALYPNHKVWPKNIQEFFAARMPEMHHNFEVLRLFIPQKRLLEYNTYRMAALLGLPAARAAAITSSSGAPGSASAMLVRMVPWKRSAPCSARPILARSSDGSI